MLRTSVAEGSVIVNFRWEPNVAASPGTLCCFFCKSLAGRILPGTEEREAVARSREALEEEFVQYICILAVCRIAVSV